MRINLPNIPRALLLGVSLDGFHVQADRNTAIGNFKGSARPVRQIVKMVFAVFLSM
jgi:hypothetical protein